MQHTALFCRTQEAQHRSRAADTCLDNARIIATNAANAWGREAGLAERRESSRARVLATAAPAGATEPSSWDRTFSDNPDRSLAGAATPATPPLPA